MQVISRGLASGGPLEQRGPGWWQQGNLNTDAYLFGFGRPGTDLIVDFSPLGGRQQAALYVVPEALRGQVSVSAQRYRLPSALRPAVTLIPRGGRWTSAGVPNFDLTGTLNTPAPFRLRVGSTVPGQPTWATTRALGPQAPLQEPAGAGTLFGAAVQEDPTVPYALAEPLIPGFPYLSAGEEDQFYGPNRPLAYLPGKREILTRFVGFQTAGIYAMNSYALPPGVAFEAPFAWYRFDPAAERFPNLVARVEQFPAGYRAAPVPEVQRTAARLSWTGQDYRQWRYSLSVVGSHPLTDPVRLGDTVARSVPYRRLPGWVSTQVWPGASFVEATTGFSGSEGLYSYSVEANPELFKWINGVSSAPPDTFRLPYLSGVSIVSPNLLPAGFRGEYSLVYNRQPTLYLSSIDRRVHLKGAQAGLWNLGVTGGVQRLLRTADLSGRGYTERWQVERWPVALPPAGPPPADQPARARPGTTEQSLYALEDSLIVSDAAGVSIVQGARPTPRPLPVPTDAAAWRAFLAGVASGSSPRRTERDPVRLRSWLTSAPGERVSLPGAALSDVRLISGGFRLVVSRSGTAATRAPSGSALTLTQAAASLGPGRHVLTWRAGRWQVQAATPPVLAARLGAPELQVYTPATLRLTLSNRGTLDRRGPARLLVGDEVAASWPDLLVPAQGAVTRQVLWTPARAGTQPVAVVWSDRPGRGQVASAAPLRVAGQRRVAGLGVLGLSSPFGQDALLALLLTTLAALAGLWLVVRRTA